METSWNGNYLRPRFDPRVVLDKEGYFALQLPPAKETRVEAEVTAPGFEPWRQIVAFGGGEAHIVLKREGSQTHDP